MKGKEDKIRGIEKEKSMCTVQYNVPKIISA